MARKELFLLGGTPKKDREAREGARQGGGERRGKENGFDSIGGYFKKGARRGGRCRQNQGKKGPRARKSLLVEMLRLPLPNRVGEGKRGCQPKKKRIAPGRWTKDVSGDCVPRERKSSMAIVGRAGTRGRGRAMYIVKRMS